MKKSLKSVTIISGLLVIFFYLYFMFNKHSPALSAILPFGEDPWDAFGSFAMIFSMILFCLIIYRTLLFFRGRGSSSRQIILILRTHAAIALGILIALSADLIAMIRQIFEWINKPPAVELILLFSGMTAFLFIVLIILRRMARKSGSPEIRISLKTSLILISWILILGLYPLNLYPIIPGELVTLALSIALYFIPLSFMVRDFIPIPVQEKKIQIKTPAPGLKSRPWIFITLLGLLIGMTAFAGEMTEGGGTLPPLNRILLVFGFFTGTAMVAAVTGYYCLKNPLGLNSFKNNQE